MDKIINALEVAWRSHIGEMNDGITRASFVNCLKDQLQLLIVHDMYDIDLDEVGVIDDDYEATAAGKIVLNEYTSRLLHPTFDGEGRLVTKIG